MSSESRRNGDHKRPQGLEVKFLWMTKFSSPGGYEVRGGLLVGHVLYFFHFCLLRQEIFEHIKWWWIRAHGEVELKIQERSKVPREDRKWCTGGGTGCDFRKQNKIRIKIRKQPTWPSMEASNCLSIYPSILLWLYLGGKIY